MPNVIKTGTPTWYKVSTSGAWTSLLVEVDGQKFSSVTQSTKPSAFSMAAIVLLRDAYLNNKTVTIEGKPQGLVPIFHRMVAIELS